MGQEDYFTHIVCSQDGICGLDFYENLKPVTDKQGEYSTHLFAERAALLVEKHSQAHPEKVGKPSISSSMELMPVYATAEQFLYGTNASLCHN